MGNKQAKQRGGSRKDGDGAAVSSGKGGKGNLTVSAMLKHVPLLGKLTDGEREKLGDALTSKSFKSGQWVFKQGDEGEGFFIISSGVVAVIREDEEGKQEELAQLKPGDFFGEAALINNAKRSAHVKAIEKVTCLYLDRAVFTSLFTKDRLNVRFAKRTAISAHRTSLKGDVIPEGAVKDKSDETTHFILESVKENLLFRDLDIAQREGVVAEMYRAEITRGVYAVKQGDIGDNLYVVESGSFKVLVDGNEVTRLGKGSLFGELALMYRQPRAATVTAAEDSVVWVVGHATFRRMVTQLSQRKFLLYCQFLRKVELLSPLAEYEREKIAEALEEVTFAAGEQVFAQGDVGDAMYIVHEGEFVVTKTPSEEDGGDEGDGAAEVARAGPGVEFGERALIKNEPRAATVTAVQPSSCLRLDRNAFALLLGPLEDIMKHKIDEEYDGVNPKADGEKGGENATEEGKKEDDAKPEAATPLFTNLRVVGTLGKGSFGHVQLVKDNSDGATYALKAVSKAQIVANGQQGHILSEKQVMEQLNHPFLVRLFCTYKDRDRLYFLLEPSLGGELFSVLRERTLFDETTARFYAGSVILAFEYMHSKDIIYRDLKPENLLLDQGGYLKMTDFGFAKYISTGKTWTLCGTPDYLAPEIVAGKGHGKGVDWWTLGIFIYEMLASSPPFFDEDPMKTYAKIMNSAVQFPSHFSKESMSLIKKLLQHKPTKRHGVVKGGAKLIKRHPWFKSFSFDNLVNRRMNPSIVPHIKDEYDLSNFEIYPEDDEGVPQYRDDGSNWDADF